MPLSAIISLITALISAIAPLVPKLISGQMTEAEAKAAADAAIAQYQNDAVALPTVEAANDAAADAEAAKTPAT